jgi:hypothetical protein
VPWRPTELGEVPTLGWLVLDWLTENLARPETQTYEPFVPTQEQADFILRFYEIDPITGARRIRRGVISRSRGWGKSPFTAGLAAVEALGPVLFAGWDASGQPVGMPWSEIRKPLVEIAAVSEDQVDTNTWSPLIDMLAGGPAIDNYPGLEPMAGFVNLPYGRIQKRTAAAGSAKGAPACFVVCDQTEEWTPGNGGRRLYNALKNNVIKRGGHLLESPNAFTEGSESVAEQTMTAFQLIRDGRAKLETGVLYDHREAPPETDMAEAESLLRGLAVAYGDSADVEHCAIHEPPCERPGWVDLEHIAASIWEPDADPQVSRSDWLNQVTHASNAWLSQPTWAARYGDRQDPPVPSVADREVVTLGFDGSRGRAKGKPDATALIGCRVADGHLFEINVWEAPADRSKWDSWTPPIPEIEAAIADAFRRYQVAAFYCDPAKDWRSFVNAWEAKYAARLVRGREGKQVTATVQHPFEWWMTGGRTGLIQRAIEQLEGAIRNGDMTHDGSYALTRHVLAARRRLSGGKLQLSKENDYSPNKIDAAVAAVLAWQARLDAVSAGIGTRRTSFVPSRLR